MQVSDEKREAMLSLALGLLDQLRAQKGDQYKALRLRLSAAYIREKYVPSALNYSLLHETYFITEARMRAFDSIRETVPSSGYDDFILPEPDGDQDEAKGAA